MNRSTARRTVTTLLAGTVLAGSALAGAGPAAAHGDERQHQEVEAPEPHPSERRVVRRATRHLRTPEAAVAAGYVPTDTCVPEMGYHYVKPSLAADLVVDPAQPEILVFVPGPAGTRRLGAVEYFRAAVDGVPAPTLFGVPFDGPMDGHGPGMPIHYDLHVWVYEHNPDGQLAAFNPRVACP